MVNIIYKMCTVQWRNPIFLFCTDCSCTTSVIRYTWLGWGKLGTIRQGFGFQHWKYVQIRIFYTNLLGWNLVIPSAKLLMQFFVCLGGGGVNEIRLRWVLVLYKLVKHCCQSYEYMQGKYYKECYWQNNERICVEKCTVYNW